MRAVRAGNAQAGFREINGLKFEKLHVAWPVKTTVIGWRSDALGFHVRDHPTARSRKSIYRDSAICTELYTENLYFRYAHALEQIEVASRDLTREVSG